MNTMLAAHGDDCMSRQKRDEMLCNANGTHTRSAAAMRDAECFMQIQMADIGTNIFRTRQPALRIHVRAIHIDLPAMRMNYVANIDNRFFENTVRRRICYHKRSENIF